MKREDYTALIDSYGNHFSIADFEHDGTIGRNNVGFLRSFLAWRQWHGIKTLVTDAWRRDNKRAHGYGYAFDCMLFNRWLSSQPSPMMCWLIANTWPFRGVGLYFDWHYTNRNGKRVPGIGLHVDGWDSDDRPLRWLRIDGLYYYQSLSNGSFYCNSNKKTITLKTAIEDFTNEQ